MSHRSQSSRTSVRHPQAEELLAERSWLLGFARALVGGDEAEDLVQDAYMVALERPPGDGLGPRAWLAGAVKNLVLRRRRGEHRRRRREAERSLAPDAAGGDVAELAERAELETVAVQRLLELREPYRSTLLLRFQAGLTAAQIARKLTLPPGTVRRRIKVGLDELRDTLDREHGNRGWALLLLGGRVAPQAVVPLPTGLLLWTPITKKLLFTSLALIALWAASTRWNGSGPTDGVPGDDATVVDLGDRDPTGLGPAQGEPANHDSVSRSGIGLGSPGAEACAWRVVGAAGEQVAVASAALLFEDGVLRLEPNGEALLVPEAMPDGSQAELLISRPGSWPLRTFAPLVPGVHEIVWPDQQGVEGRLLAGGVGPGEPLELVLRRDTGWAGWLTAAQDRELGESGAVRLGANAEGEFEIAALPVGWRGWVELPRGWSFSGGGKRSVPFETGVGRVELEIGRHRRLTGRLVAQGSGEAVPDLLIQMLEYSARGEITGGLASTDGSGRFEFSLAHETYRAVLDYGLSPGYRPQRSEVEELPEEGELELGTLAVARAPLIELEVLDRAGRPVAEARVRQPERTSRPAVETDDSGRAHWTVMGDEACRLQVYAPGFRTGVFDVNPSADAVQQLTLEPGLRLEVQVVAADGEPLRGHSVVWSWEDSRTPEQWIRDGSLEFEMVRGWNSRLGPPRKGVSRRTLVTDDEGWIVVDGVQRGLASEVRVADHSGVGAGEVQQVVADAEGVCRLRLEDGSGDVWRIAGVVRSPAGTPIGEASVLYRASGTSGDSGTARADAEGRFRFAVPAEGGVSAILSAPGFAREALDWSPGELAAGQLEIVLTYERDLELEIVREGLEPLGPLKLVLQEQARDGGWFDALTMHPLGARTLRLYGFGRRPLRAIVDDGFGRQEFEFSGTDPRPRIELARVPMFAIQVKFDDLPIAEGDSIHWFMKPADSKSRGVEGRCTAEELNQGGLELACPAGEVRLVVFLGAAEYAGTVSGAEGERVELRLSRRGSDR